MFEPDIIVTEPGDYAKRFIVIEVKAHPAALMRVEDDLRRYMVRNNFPLGLLVAPGEIRIYRNRFENYTESSVHLLGAFALAEFDDFASASTSDRSAMARLEDAVQAWIQRLPSPETLAAMPSPLREVIEDEVVPYVVGGDVRAAHHRYGYSAASDIRAPR